MRLTLRTLLAYLDGILDGDDAQELATKIDESEFATGLVHRIRDVVRRLRLGAPSLPEAGQEHNRESEHGPSLDPNTVAEYLDNTLAPDQVTDFEKVCLDSDVYLAEVASCHQVLTLVLGEPAEVEPESRQQMYQLKDIPLGGRMPPPPPTFGTTAPPISVPLSLDLGDDELEGRKSRTKPTVPEYLRESRRRPAWLPIAAAVFLCLCAVVVVLKTFGQFEPETPIGNLLVQAGIIELPAKVAKTTGGEDTKKGVETPSDKPDAGSSVAIAGTQTTPTAGTVSTATTPSAATASSLATVPPTTVVPPATTSSTASVAIGPGPVAPPTGSTATQGSTATVATIPPGIVTPSVATPTPSAPATAAATGDTAKPTEVASAVKPDALKGKTSMTPPAPVERLPEPLAQLRSSDQILLAADASGEWTRVAANQLLLAQQLLVLPTYRAKVEMTRGVEASILGDTRVELQNAEMQKPLGIRVFYGRVVLRPLAKAGTQLQLTFGDHVGILKFAESDSTVALDVHRIHMPGMNPETEPLRVMADMYGTIDDVTWTEIIDGKPSEPITLKPRNRLSFDFQMVAEPVSAKELPAWIVAEPINDLDRRASAVIAEALPTDRLARDGLLESALSRPQKEVKWLALRCLGSVGNFSDVVAALNDPNPNFRLNWPDYIDLLRTAVARDAESAAAVRADLEKQYPGQSEDLYEMLWGYTDKKLEDGADAKLVRGLENDKLAVRVLSIWNLKNITGLGGEYRPEYTATKRQPLAQRWWRRLEAKEIRMEPAAAKKPVPRKTATPSKATPGKAAPSTVTPSKEP